MYTELTKNIVFLKDYIQNATEIPPTFQTVTCVVQVKLGKW